LEGEVRVIARSGIYVEIYIDRSLDNVWSLSQDPSLHQRWDLRFSRIEYLPRSSSDEPQRFLYQTRIGFGLNISGTGESTGLRSLPDRSATSCLKFDSADPKALIRQGSGYWRYIPSGDGTRFLTWYDYKVRFGVLGRLADRLFFRPLMGWSTAWSFDRLRLWAETGQLPECSRTLALIHATARVSIACVWFWHGLVPKLVFHDIDEQLMLTQAGLPATLLPWIGGLEILLAVGVLCMWNRRVLFLAVLALMVVATVLIGVSSPSYLTVAFNPVSLNGSVIALCMVGWLSSRTLPSARKCSRSSPGERR
jgi:hypothetical protein